MIILVKYTEKKIVVSDVAPLPLHPLKEKNIGRLLLLTYINDLHETLCDSAFHFADCMENVFSRS